MFPQDLWKHFLKQGFRDTVQTSYVETLAVCAFPYNQYSYGMETTQLFQSNKSEVFHNLIIIQFLEKNEKYQPNHTEGTCSLSVPETPYRLEHPTT